MKNTAAFIILLFISCHVLAQHNNLEKDNPYQKHYISINPLNMTLFQQLGLSYEYKLSQFGFGISTGYIYPNHKKYSNYFIAGPTNKGSLGDYSGYFIIPQINFYFLQIIEQEKNKFLYLYIKPVYRNITLDSTYATQWINHGEANFTFRNMDDDVNIFGGFFGLGYKFLYTKFFFDLNLGIGNLTINHDMKVYKTSTPYAAYYEEFDPPLEEKIHESNYTINFSFNIGIAL